MVAREVVSRAEYKRGKPCNEVSRSEQQVCGAIAEGPFEAQANLAIGV